MEVFCFVDGLEDKERIKEERSSSSEDNWEDEERR